jgi:lysophospholipase L1-like esterase
MAVRANLLLAQGATNLGVSGETSTEIKDRFVSQLDVYKSRPATFWAGRNNITDPTTIKADIATMVAGQVNSNYLVLAICPNSSQQESLGQANYARLVTLNSDLATTYGAKFFDVKAYLQGFGNGSAQDLADIAADLVPSSLRADSMHLNTAGYDLVAARIKVLMGLQ